MGLVAWAVPIWLEKLIRIAESSKCLKVSDMRDQDFQTFSIVRWSGCQKERDFCGRSREHPQGMFT